VHLATITTP